MNVTPASARGVVCGPDGDSRPATMPMPMQEAMLAKSMSFTTIVSISVLFICKKNAYLSPSYPVDDSSTSQCTDKARDTVDEVKRQDSILRLDTSLGQQDGQEICNDGYQHRRTEFMARSPYR